MRVMARRRRRKLMERGERRDRWRERETVRVTDSNLYDKGQVVLKLTLYTGSGDAVSVKRTSCRHPRRLCVLDYKSKIPRHKSENRPGARRIFGV